MQQIKYIFNDHNSAGELSHFTTDFGFCTIWKWKLLYCFGKDSFNLKYKFLGLIILSKLTYVILELRLTLIGWFYESCVFNSNIIKLMIIGNVKAKTNFGEFKC